MTENKLVVIFVVAGAILFPLWCAASYFYGPIIPIATITICVGGFLGLFLFAFLYDTRIINFTK